MKNLKYLGKRGLALFLSLVLCLGLVPGTAAAAEGGGTSEDDPCIIEADGVGLVSDLQATLNKELGSGKDWIYYGSTTILGQTIGAWLPLL